MVSVAPAREDLDTRLGVAAHERAAASKLEVSDLTIRYGSHVALAGVSLEVREHEILGIIGPANAGKTSFLKVVNRMDLFDSAMQFDGTIRFDGVDTRRWRNTNLVQQARRLADRTAFFLEGRCVEVGETEALFDGEVADARTRDYIEGKFG